MIFSSKMIRLHWLQVITHMGAWVPLAVLIFDFFTGQLTVNPIQAAEQRAGDIAITLLILSLACTPINTLFRFTPVLKIRRALGLYAYFYAAVHLFLFIGVDYGFNFHLIIDDVGNKRFILVGLTSFIVLTILAITSFRWWKVRLGKNWKRLHRTVYGVNLLVVLHYAWAMKGDIFRLQGNILLPLLAGFIVILLLIVRLPPVRKRVAGILRLQFHSARRGNMKNQAKVKIMHEKSTTS